MDKFVILILESLYEDYYWLWETYSECSQYYNKEHNNDFRQEFKERISILIGKGYISVYEDEGDIYAGEEKQIEPEITDEFLEELLNHENMTGIMMTTSLVGRKELEKSW